MSKNETKAVCSDPDLEGEFTSAEELSAEGLLECSGVKQRGPFSQWLQKVRQAQFYYLGNVTNARIKKSIKQSLEMINEISKIHSIIFCS